MTIQYNTPFFTPSSHSLVHTHSGLFFHALTHQFIESFTHLPAHLSIYPINPLHASIHQLIHPSTHPSTYPFTHQFIHPSIHSPIYPFTHPLPIHFPLLPRSCGGPLTFFMSLACIVAVLLYCLRVSNMPTHDCISSAELADK